MNFIKTFDDNVAARLKAAHFSYLGKNTEDMHVFVNDGIMTFDEIEKNKITYSNILAM